MSKRELRISAVPRTLELRSNSDGTKSIAGEAVVYNSLSEDLGGFRERIAPGAFRNSLSDTEVMCLYSHDDSRILGRQSSGTLTVTDGPDALRFMCKLPDTQDGQTVAALCTRGDLKGMSFGFVAVQDKFEQDASGGVIRTVLKATLYELSAVGNPAYAASSVSLRSCPANLRAKLSTRSHDDDDDDDDSDGINIPDDMNDGEGDEDDGEDDECRCLCAECRNGDCDECSNTLCEDNSCEDCRIQERSYQYEMILRRLRA